MPQCHLCGGLDGHHAHWCPVPWQELEAQEVAAAQEERERRPRRHRSLKYSPVSMAFRNRSDEAPGVWMIYDWEARGRGRRAVLISTHVEAHEAVSALSDGQRIGFLYFGKPFVEAVEQWEARSTEDKAAALANG